MQLGGCIMTVNGFVHSLLDIVTTIFAKVRVQQSES